MSAWPCALSGGPASVLRAPQLTAHNLLTVLTQVPAVCPVLPQATSSLDCLIPAPGCLSPVHPTTATHCAVRHAVTRLCFAPPGFVRVCFLCPSAGPGK